MAVRNVYKEEVNKVTIPSIAQTEDRGVSRCGEPLPVIADITNNSRSHNDVTGIAEICSSLTVQLERLDGTLISAPGTSVSFPYQSNALGYVIDWRQLTRAASGGGVELDEGCYKVKVSGTTEGVSWSYYYGAFNLLKYTVENTADTVQVFSVLNDVVRKDKINYKDSGFANAIRFRGWFGWMQPNYETRNITYNDRTRRKVRNEALRTYELRTSYLVDCFTEKIDEQHLLAASNIWISEYSASQHKQYTEFPVIIDEEQSPSFEYPTGVYAKVVAFFKDKVAVHESKYDGNIEASENVTFNLPQGVQQEGCADATVQNSDLSYSDTVPSGTTQLIPDSQLNVNSVDIGDVVSVKTIDVNVTDGEGDNLTPIISLFGNTLGLVVPSEWAYFTLENSASANIRMTTNSGGNFVVDWGDGTITSYASANTDRSHTYASPYSGAVRIKAVNGLSDIIFFRSTVGVWNFDIALLNQLPNLNEVLFAGSSMTLTGDISALSSLTFEVFLAGNSMTLNYTPTTWTTIPSNSLLLNLATGFLATSAEVDNLLIDLNATGESGSATIDLRYDNAPRTASSDAAVTALASRGYTVLTN